MPPPLLLLPPSEGKAPGGRRRGSDRFAPVLGEHRTLVTEALAKAMAAASEPELEKLLRVRGPLLTQAVAATNALLDGNPQLLPAWQRYDGIVWQFLDPATVPSALRTRILVPSALYGITTANDPIAEYRLGMATSLPGVGNVARHWRGALGDLLARHRRRATIIDLLPTEHRRAIDWGRVGPVVVVDFTAADGQGAAGHAAKAVKGRFARHLIDHGVTEALGFTFEGWRIRPTDRGFELLAPG